MKSSMTNKKSHNEMITINARFHSLPRPFGVTTKTKIINT